MKTLKEMSMKMKKRGRERGMNWKDYRKSKRYKYVDCHMTFFYLSSLRFRSINNAIIG